MVATRIEQATPDGDISELFISACSTRNQVEAPNPNQERRSKRSVSETFEGLIDRIQKLDILNPIVADAYKTLSQLLKLVENDPASIKLGNGQPLPVNLLVDVLDKCIHDNAQRYVSAIDKTEATKEQMRDFIGALVDTGLLSNSDLAIELLEKSAPQDLALARDAALFEASLALKNSLRNSLPRGQARSQTELSCYIDGMVLDSTDNPAHFAKEFFGCKCEQDSLLVEINFEGGPDTSGKAVFRLEHFDQYHVNDVSKLFEIARQLRSKEQATTVTERKWFKMLSQLGRLEQLSNCTIKDSCIFARSSHPIKLSNVHFEDCTCSFDGAVAFKNVSFSRSRILFKTSEGSTLDSTKIDKQSTIAGSLKASAIGSDSEFHGYAATLDLRQCTWHLRDGESANKRMLGLVVHTANIDQGFLDAIKKYRHLSADEVTAKHVAMNEAFDSTSMLKTLEKAGIDCQILDPEDSNKIAEKYIGPAANDRAMNFIPIWPRKDDSLEFFSALVPAKTSESDYFVSLFFCRDNLLGSPEPSFSPIKFKAGSISLLTLGIFELCAQDNPPFFDHPSLFAPLGNFASKYLLNKPKSVDWPPPYRPTPTPIIEVASESTRDGDSHNVGGAEIDDKAPSPAFSLKKHTPDEEEAQQALLEEQRGLLGQESARKGKLKASEGAERAQTASGPTGNRPKTEKPEDLLQVEDAAEESQPHPLQARDSFRTFKKLG